ncbi:MAG: hypothetical protein LC777_06205 [Actinobacteria bacterium]|nr:hypothetical protein [Actinomycetota bacterium]
MAVARVDTNGDLDPTFDGDRAGTAGRSGRCRRYTLTTTFPAGPRTRTKTTQRIVLR